MEQQPDAQQTAAVLEDDLLDQAVLEALADALDLDDTTDVDTTAFAIFPLMPLGEAVDMGHAEDGTPLFDPRIFDSASSSATRTRTTGSCATTTRCSTTAAQLLLRHPLRDITTGYFDDLGFNTIPRVRRRACSATPNSSSAASSIAVAATSTAATSSGLR